MIYVLSSIFGGVLGFAWRVSQPPSFGTSQPYRIKAQAVEGLAYRIKKGDTLWSIAREQTGTPLSWSMIYRANAHIIGNNPDLIAEGATIVIPSKLLLA